MSNELDSVLERCVSLLTQGPARTREEIAALLNHWEEIGLISRQMRAVIMQRLRASQSGKLSPLRDLDPVERDHNSS